VEGSAYDCGRQYAALVQQRHPGFDRFLRRAGWSSVLEGGTRSLFERRAPYVLELDRGLADGAQGTAARREHEQAGAGPAAGEGCTSFGVSGAVTLEGDPISGQTKDTPFDRAALYVALRLRVTGAPATLSVVYPGELLGYGFWSNGMSIFRNSLYSTAGAQRGLPMEQWAYLALASGSVHEAIELAQRHGIRGAGSCLLTDGRGESASVEFNAAGVNVVPAKDGIATHANHPEGSETSRLDCSWERHGYAPSERECSTWRMHGLWGLLHAERGRLTAQKALLLLGDHTNYPHSICRHEVGGQPEQETTAAVVAEPVQGRLHVVRGQPCANRSVTYTI
jgi:isopenicillin-N N-acyltransferase-like protein